MGDTTIGWTEKTWNPVSGCSKVSRGCDHCYAETIAERFRGGPAYPNGFELTLKPHKLAEPLRWKTPCKVFVNSMSDLFHRDIPREYLDHVFGVMEQASRHQFQVLTKRSSLLRNYVNARYRLAPEHIWLGASIEDRAALVRLRHLRETHAAVRMVSFEPLLEDLGEMDLSGIHWVIVGGESGPNRRPLELDWVRRLRDQCLEQGVPFFYKQGGAARPGQQRILDGRTWDEYPALAR